MACIPLVVVHARLVASVQMVQTTSWCVVGGVLVRGCKGLIWLVIWFTGVGIYWLWLLCWLYMFIVFEVLFGCGIIYSFSFYFFDHKLFILKAGS